ncbi:MAG: hypothetical protein HUK16_07910 [Bacteroidales bacterium]|nr:hypothetical protein [Bacteroidales bacterium]
MMANENAHCVAYFGYPQGDALQMIACLANDSKATIEVFSYLLNGKSCPSLQVVAMERFEREIAENYGIVFEGHRWPKPVRTAPDDYPFYRADDEELHEVGVGPIHAGVIEPGHFRFTCEGEKILNLEIMLGFQHRGVERLMLEKPMLSQKAMLAESVAGDTAVGHGIAFARTYEALCDCQADARVEVERMIASELERIAIHTGDLSALCGDVAYQLGNAVYGRLRTPIINFMQKWCGNRLGKTMVRPFEAPYDLTPELIADLHATLNAYEKDFTQMSDKIKRCPSVLARLERTGTVTREQALEIGAVGMAARASGLARDIRCTHPYLKYDALQPVVKKHGDVYSRTQVRMEEIYASLTMIRQWIDNLPVANASKAATPQLQAERFAISLVEGWRGEICHVAITDSRNQLAFYKIKDPSFHNWTALELAVRDNEISDFPICNKSFNLSYCGHDL